MNETLILRDSDLSKFYSPRKDILESSIKKAYLEVEKLKSRNLASDSKIITEIENRLENQYFNMKYPQLNLGFLAMSNKREAQVPRRGFSRKTSKTEISVPKFSVYSLFGDNSTNKFNIHFFKKKNFLKAAFNFYPAVCTIMDSYYFGKLDNLVLSNYSKLFEKEGFTQLELNGSSFGHRNWHHSITFQGKTGDIKRYSTEEHSGVSLKSEFVGLIPEPTLKKIEVAKKDFRDNIYVITETKPEEWDITHFTEDPLAVGIKNEYAYLIDPFDTTPLEEIVSGAFRKEKSN